MRDFTNLFSSIVASLHFSNVYTELYIDSNYLLKLDNLFITLLQECVSCEVDRVNNKVRSKNFNRPLSLLNMNSVITPKSYDNQKLK